MYNSSIQARSQNKINTSKQFRHQYSPHTLQQSTSQPSIQQYLQTQNSTKILSFKQSLNMLPDIQTIQFEDNSRYHGQIAEDGIRQGIGIFETQQGDIYMGDWRNDAYHGYGMYVYGQGQRYEGELFEGMKEGEGKYYYIDGRVYEGMWNGDQRQGHGIERDTLKGIYYEGEWLDDQKHGQGKICLLNPTDWALPPSQVTLIQGTWNKDKFSAGIIETQLFKGQFQNQTLTGPATYKFSDGSVYQGNFINNLMQGNGIYYYANGDIYEGEFFCGLKHGKGVYKYYSGDVYTGGYQKDIKCGEGRFAFVNGNYYVGDFGRDCFHGKGKYFFSKDQVVEGWWENGKLIRNEKGEEIGNNRKMALLKGNAGKTDRTGRNDRNERSRSPVVSRSPINRSPLINTFSSPNIALSGQNMALSSQNIGSSNISYIENKRSVSPFNVSRSHLPMRQQKAGSITINPSQSPINKSKFMQVHTPGDSYFKSPPPVNRSQLPSTSKKQQSSAISNYNSNLQDKSNVKLKADEGKERESDKKLFEMLDEGEVEYERRERKMNGESVTKSDYKVGMTGQGGNQQQNKKISKKFQR